MSCPPYITESGDLFCARCGERYDEAENEDCENKYDLYYDGYEEKKASDVVQNISKQEDEKQ
jgi:hypothetical protein